jgi:hypothetical protein
VQPVVDFHIRLSLAIAILLPQETGKFIEGAAQEGDIIVSELAPLLFNLVLELRLLASYDVVVRVHASFSW